MTNKSREYDGARFLKHTVGKSQSVRRDDKRFFEIRSQYFNNNVIVNITRLHLGIYRVTRNMQGIYAARVQQKTETNKKYDFSNF